jgi:hypothetical protein
VTLSGNRKFPKENELKMKSLEVGPCLVGAPTKRGNFHTGTTHEEERWSHTVGGLEHSIFKPMSTKHCQ